MLVLQTRMTNKIIMALGYKMKHMLDLADRLEKLSIRTISFRHYVDTLTKKCPHLYILRSAHARLKEKG